MDKQDKIIQHTLTEQKFPTHSIDRLLKDKNHSMRIEAQERKKQAMDEKMEVIRKNQQKSQMEQLKSEINE